MHWWLRVISLFLGPHHVSYAWRMKETYQYLSHCHTAETIGRHDKNCQVMKPAGAHQGGTMEDDSTSKVSYACVTDPAFLQLWQLANQQALTRERFLTLPMPENAQAEDVWAAICTLREWGGHDVGFNENRMLRFWVNLSERGKELVRDITRRSNEASIIGRYIATVGFKHAFMEAKVDSIRTALSLDGMTTDYESVRAVLTEESKASTPTERLIANYNMILEEEFTGTTITNSQRNARALFSALADGVSTLQEIQWDTTVLANLDACLANATQASDEMAFCAARYFLGAGHDIFFASHLQATFSSLLRKIYFIRSGHSNLALLPLSSRYVSEGAPQTANTNYDLSASVERMLEAIGPLIDDMERIAQTQLERIDAIKAALDKSPTFNLRQKAILSKSLENLHSEFDYETTAARFQVSYNTTRTDMGHLVAAGLLRTTLDGHRTVLCPAPGFIRTLNRLLLEQ